MLEFTGSPILLPFYPGTGVYDIVVRVREKTLKKQRLSPLENFRFNFPMRMSMDPGSGWVAILEMKMLSNDLYVHFLVDTRFLAPVENDEIRPIAIYPEAKNELEFEDFIADRARMHDINLATMISQGKSLESVSQKEAKSEIENQLQLDDRKIFFGVTGEGILEGKSNFPIHSLETSKLRNEFDIYFKGQQVPSNYEILLVDSLKNVLLSPKIKFGVVKQSPFEKIINVGLVIDLGNTRSYALVVDDLCGHSSFYEPQVRELELKSYANWMDNGETGVFDSTLGFGFPFKLPEKILSENLPENLKKPVPFSENLSFVRIGGEGRRMQRLVSAEKTNRGSYSLSSPKRYYWQEDPEAMEWRLWNPLWKENEEISLPLHGVLAQALKAKFGDSLPEKRLPRSSMLAALFIEFIEQAERVLNNPDYLKQTSLPGPRRISRVLITYPPAWTKSEVKLYQRQLARGLEAFSAIRSLPVPNFELECDEASAVLLNYVYSEIHKYGLKGDNWISAVGKKGEYELAVVRIAIIDLGGGTSDLMIADVIDTLPGKECRLKIERCYQDGVNRAGDELMRKMITNIALPSLGWSLYESGGEEWENLVHLMLSSKNPKLQEMRKYWTRDLWLPLAIKIIENVVSGKNENIGLTDLSDQLLSFDAEARKIAREIPNFHLSPISEFQNELELPSEFRKVVNRNCQEVFSSICRRFGAAVAAFNCDLVVFAGKTSEIPDVRELFMNYIPLPPKKFIPLKGYQMGSWYPLSADGRVRDAKTTTGFGGAIYLLASEGSPQLGAGISIEINDAPGLGEKLHYWGVIQPNSLRFANRDAIFGPESANREQYILPLNSRTLLIGRRRFKYEPMDAEIAYELRIRPEYASLGAPKNAKVTLEYQVNHDDSVELMIKSTHGKFANDQEIKVEHLELRHRSLAHNDFWIDSGKIYQ